MHPGAAVVNGQNLPYFALALCGKAAAHCMAGAAESQAAVVSIDLCSCGRARIEEKQLARKAFRMKKTHGRGIETTSVEPQHDQQSKLKPCNCSSSVH